MHLFYPILFFALLNTNALAEHQSPQTKLNLPDFMPQGEDKIRQREFISVMDERLNDMVMDLMQHFGNEQVLSASERSKFKASINKVFSQELPITKELNSAFMAILDKPEISSIEAIAFKMANAVRAIKKNLKNHYKKNRKVYLQKQLVITNPVGEKETIEVVRDDFTGLIVSYFFSGFISTLK